MAFTVEELARAALVRILPAGRYRLAAQTDSRFASFVANTTRVAYRQQGGTPAFLLFSGPGQDARAAALAAAAWAEANWRPNAIQRRVRPGVVVVHLAPGSHHAAAGAIPGAAVPAAVWTVDADSGALNAFGKPPGAPSPSVIKEVARGLSRGMPAPSLGELDQAERGVMQMRTMGMPRALTGIVGVLLVVFGLRYAFGGLIGLMALPALIQGGFSGIKTAYLIASLAEALILVGVVIGVAVFFNWGNFAYRLPGFSSPLQRTRNLTWGAYIGVMVALAVVVDGVVPALERSTIAGTTDQSQYLHVSATAADDGSETYVLPGGDLTVDLSGWPSTEWAGVTFKTSNPTVLSLDAAPQPGGKPVARFGAHELGAARVEATSADGKYSFQLRVNVFSG